ncbi:MAG: sensor histidine kinase [Ruminococcus sp.]
MDSADKFINNKSPKRLVLIYIIMLVILTAAAYFVSGKCTDVIVEKQLTAVLSAASGDTNFTGYPSEESVTAGEKVFSVYGVSSDMNLRLIDSYTDIFRMIFTALIIFLYFTNTLWLICSICVLFKTYSQVETLRVKCIDISEKTCVEVSVSAEEFSCIKRLSDAIDILSDRLRYLNSSLMKEKEFLREFLTDFSHQIKTSLAVIRLNSDILAESDNISKKSQSRLANEISINTDSMESLTVSALKLAKLNADAVEYRMTYSDLNETCSSAIRRIDPLLRDTEIKIHFDALSEQLFMNHDRLWLCEAVENIIKNSADHSGCTDIIVKTEKTPVSITISIEDNGKGIPQSDIPNIFTRFGKKSNNVQMSSVGIGMSVAKKVTEAHNGQIIVYSEKDSGTRFDMIFLN